MQTTRVTRHVDAPPSAVYPALLDAEDLARWRVPDGMTCRVHELDAREGGAFRVSLTYDAPGERGKSGGATDTYHGRFLTLVPDERVVEEIEFETEDEAFRGTMTMTTTLTPAGEGTDVAVLHEGLPDGVPAEADEVGTRMALANLARLVEGRRAGAGRAEPGRP